MQTFRRFVSRSVLTGALLAASLSAQCPVFSSFGVDDRMELGSIQVLGAVHRTAGHGFMYLAVPLAGGVGGPLPCSDPIGGVPCCFYGSPIGLVWVQDCPNPPCLHLTAHFQIPASPALEGAFLVLHTGVLTFPIHVDALSTRRIELVARHR